LVYGFTGFHGRFKDAGVAHHIAIGKVEADKIDFFLSSSGTSASASANALISGCKS
jgi:hypothetical protein